MVPDAQIPRRECELGAARSGGVVSVVRACWREETVLSQGAAPPALFVITLRTRSNSSHKGWARWDRAQVVGKYWERRASLFVAPPLQL